MATYKVEKIETFRKTADTTAHTTLFCVGFADPAQNDVIVRDASALMDEIGEIGGQLALVNGPASLPVAMVICHRLAHRFGMDTFHYLALSFEVIIQVYTNGGLKEIAVL